MKFLNFSNLMIGVLLLLNATLLLKFFESRNEKKLAIELNAARDRVYKSANNKIPYNKILIPFTPSLDSNLSKQIEKSDFSILVLFEPNQCGACLEEKILWNKLNDDKVLPVYAITYLKNKKELSQYLDDSKTTIPVYQDTLASIGKWVMPEGVPVKLLVNKNHEIILVDYVRRTASERDDFVKMLKFYLNTYKL